MHEGKLGLALPLVRRTREAPTDHGEKYRSLMAQPSRSEGSAQPRKRLKGKTYDHHGGDSALVRRILRKALDGEVLATAGRRETMVWIDCAGIGIANDEVKMSAQCVGVDQSNAMAETQAL